MYFPVFIAITEQKLTESYYVTVVDLGDWDVLQLLLPVDLRLANAVSETKWFDARRNRMSLESGRALQTHHATQGISVELSIKRLEEAPVRQRTSPPDGVSWRGGGAPFPLFG